MEKALTTYLEGMESRLTERMATKEDLVALEARTDEKLSELSESIRDLASHVDERFDDLAPAMARFDHQDKRISYLEKRVTDLAK
jgi:hypothetical protein